MPLKRCADGVVKVDFRNQVLGIEALNADGKPFIRYSGRSVP